MFTLRYLNDDMPEQLVYLRAYKNKVCVEVSNKISSWHGFFRLDPFTGRLYAVFELPGQKEQQSLELFELTGPKQGPREWNGYDRQGRGITLHQTSVLIWDGVSRQWIPFCRQCRVHAGFH